MEQGAAVRAATVRRPRHAWRVVRWVAVSVGVATLVVAAVFGIQYRRQITSYLTHWKGSPTSTEPYVAYPPDQRPELRIGVAGDIGDSGTRLEATAESMAQLDPGDPFDELLLLGDNVYPDGDPAKLQDTVFDPFADVLAQGAELLAIVGNHDAPHGEEQMAEMGMPGLWWAVERDDTLIVGLDSNETADPAQREFLEQTLRDSEATWKIVAVHHPPYSAGYQGSNLAVRETFGPLFERYGVQLVLSGHDHDYQRSVEIDGVTYVVTGAASGTRRTGEEDFTAESFSWHSYVVVDVFPDRIVGRAVNQDGRVADEWTLSPD